MRNPSRNTIKRLLRSNEPSMIGREMQKNQYFLFNEVGARLFIMSKGKICNREPKGFYKYLTPQQKRYYDGKDFTYETACKMLWKIFDSNDFFEECYTATFIVSRKIYDKIYRKHHNTFIDTDGLLWINTSDSYYRPIIRFNDGLESNLGVEE